jgi:hypothetical protein
MHEDEETECLESPDGLHCVHWYEGEACCYCVAPASAGDDIREA